MSEFVEYQRQPDVVKAVQWDGTAEGGKAIAILLMRNYKSADVTVHHNYLGFNPAEIWLEFENPELRNRQRMRSGFWLTRGRDGLNILSDSEFNQLYKKK